MQAGVELITRVSVWLVPAFLLGIPLIGAAKGLKVYDLFIEGASEGLLVAARLVPYLIAIFIAVSLLRESGALALASRVLGPVAGAMGINPDLIGLALLRPISGSGSLAMLAGILQAHGPDSFVGRLACTMQGSSDTTLYILAVYFGSVGVTRTRHALLVGLAADIAGFAGAVVACRLLFG
ncbi:MAG: spore maturation protein [Firmicutes bacterium]|nr:spore maturation protein [Bacillota bacterium]